MMDDFLPDPKKDVLATQEFIETNKDYAWSSSVDALGLQQTLDMWPSPSEAPRLTWWNNLLTDTGHHEGGPHSSIAHASMRDADARLGVLLDHLEKIGALDPGVEIKNGSGLFDANRATAHELATLLRWAYREPSIQPEMLAQLSIGGVDGTLRGRFKSQHDRRAVRAKTGTLDDSVALSGYVLAPPGKSPVAFSILIHNCKGRVGVARGFADKIVDKILKELWAGT